MFAYIAAFLRYKPAKFESTIDRWERKGMLKRIGTPPEVQPHDGRSRFDIVDFVQSQLERATAARMAVRGMRYPANRWRLRRLYRWQQRQKTKEPREYWDDIALGPPTRSS